MSAPVCVRILLVVAAVPLSLYVSIYSVVFAAKVMKIFTAASTFFSSGSAQILQPRLCSLIERYFAIFFSIFF